LNYTENFDNAAWYVRWGGSGVVIRDTDKFTAPDGTQTVYKCIATFGSAGVGQAVTLTAGVAYTFSCWVNTPVNNAEIRFATVAFGGGTVAQSTIVSGSLLTRVSLTYTPTVTQTYYIGVAQTVAGQITYVWGAQLEAGSIATSYIPSVETFTGRASTATYYDSTGIVRSAASGQPRYSYNPALLSAPPKLLLEAQSTNLFTYSEQFNNSVWPTNNTTITVNSVVSPDGSATADTLVRGASANIEAMVRATTTQSTSTTYTLSVYVKAGTAGAYLYLRNLAVNNALPNGLVVFNPATGLIVSAGSGYASATMLPVGNGWHRCVLTGTTPASIATNLVDIGTCNAAGVATGNVGDAIYIWGAQLEAGSGATSYIPTVASQVTRVADSSTSAAQSRASDVYSSSQVTRAVDSASITGSNFSSWYRQDEGTLFGESSFISAFPNTVVGTLSDNPSLNAILLDQSGGGMRLFIRSGGTNNVSLTTPNILTNSVKFVGAYKTDDAIGAGNGGLSSADTSVVVPFVNRLDIGRNTIGNNTANFTLKRLTYYPTRVTNIQLQGLTS
jgi:hypothetical protein